MSVNISCALSEKDIEQCFKIRHQVFVVGMGVPLIREQDGLDAESDQFIVKIEDVPVGTARVRYLGDKAKIERVAITSNHQGQGIGKKLILHIVEHIQSNNKAKKVILASQVYAISFYEKLGFRVVGDEFIDAGLPHQNMEMAIG